MLELKLNLWSWDWYQVPKDWGRRQGWGPWPQTPYFLVPSAAIWSGDCA